MQNGRNCEKPNREIRENDDIYPLPQMTRSPSYKMVGFDKIYYAIIYLKHNRVATLIRDVQSGLDTSFAIDEKTYFGLNLLAMATEENFGANIMYYNHKKEYNCMFWLIVTSLSPSNINKLLRDIRDSETITKFPIIDYIYGKLISRPHILIALWNYGLEMDSSASYNKYIKKMSLQKLTTVSSKSFTPGRRFLLLNTECPITLNTISRPAILSDGTVYEYDAIVRHLKRSNTDPLTNTVLSRKYFHITRSIKHLYLPLENKFKMID